MTKTKEITELKGIHKKILRSLAVCEYLTLPHFDKLALGSKSYVNKKLRELRKGKKALVDIRSNGKRGGGRNPFFFCLTKYGKTCTSMACNLPTEKVKAP